MSETQIPDDIKHLDFDLEDETNSSIACRAPLGQHPVTDDVIRCNAPAVFIASWNKLHCGCCPADMPLCTACWTGFTEGKIPFACAKQHGPNVKPSDLRSLSPIK